MARLMSILVAVAIFHASGLRGPAMALEVDLVYTGSVPAPQFVFYNYSMFLGTGESIQFLDKLVLEYDNILGAPFTNKNFVTDELISSDSLILGSHGLCTPPNCATTYVRNDSTSTNFLVAPGTIPGTIKYTFYYTFTTVPDPATREFDYFTVDFGQVADMFNAYFDPTVTLVDQNFKVKYKGQVGGSGGDPGSPSAQAFAARKSPGAKGLVGASLRNNTREWPRRGTKWPIGGRDAATSRPTAPRSKSRGGDK